MPRLVRRQEALVQGRVTGRAPGCIACGNRRLFWVCRDDEQTIANAWEIEPRDRVIACGRCRSRHSVLYDIDEG